MPLPVIAIFDIGKTNKKLFLFDESYRVVHEQSIQLEETVDEEGDACEDIELLRNFIINSLNDLLQSATYDIRALNFSTYGASFVYVDEKGQPIAPLYNYLKNYPPLLQNELHDANGGEEQFSLRTASPSLGSLNSGLQLYRIKKQQPGLFARIKWALHLPQFASFLLTNEPVAEITSIGCHTALWDYTSNTYHSWTSKENVDEKFPAIRPSDETYRKKINGKELICGIGLHDSSAALIPYLVNFEEPFVLISTGTWCISLNPFNDTPLTIDELKQDCLCYFTYRGRPVKASRLFAGNEHEQQIKRMSKHFKQPADYYKSIAYNPEWKSDQQQPQDFATVDLSSFDSYEEAYHHLMWNITLQQKQSTALVLTGVIVKRIFVDGGFSQNALYMNMLSKLMAGVEIYSASMAQATALGAALAIHHSWNTQSLRTDLIQLKYFSDREEALNL